MVLWRPSPAEELGTIVYTNQCAEFRIPPTHVTEMVGHKTMHRAFYCMHEGVCIQHEAKSSVVFVSKPHLESKCHTARDMRCSWFIATLYDKCISSAIFSRGQYSTCTNQSTCTLALSCYMASYNNHRFPPTILQYAREETGNEATEQCSLASFPGLLIPAFVTTLG